MMKLDNQEHQPEPETEPWLKRHWRQLLPVAAAVIYYFSNPKPQNYYDYTFRVAGNLLSGRIGFAEQPPGWLNEFVPFEGLYYSVFPLGAVLTMIPAAMLKTVGIITEMPGSVLAAFCAGLIAWFLLKLADGYGMKADRAVLMTAGVLFGTFMWTNFTFGGAWQLALGFAMIGELGAIYFTIFDRRPLLAGVFFALAFGNRTENLLTAPVFMFLLCRPPAEIEPIPEPIKAQEKARTQKRKLVFDRIALLKFCIVPTLLGVATLGYNYIRFHSFTDFGYARIPGVLQEPWYNHGIFATEYIPRQAWEMLGKIWHPRARFPYLFPDGFSNSIIFSSPFLLLLVRVGSRDGALKLASWTAVAILTFLLWIHGNSGGWQFGYRYAMVLLPWTFVIMAESAPKRVTKVEWALYVVSFIANLYATWIFHWTEYLKT